MPLVVSITYPSSLSLSLSPFFSPQFSLTDIHPLSLSRLPLHALWLFLSLSGVVDEIVFGLEGAASGPHP
jgi:hypothetical protein